VFVEALLDGNKNSLTMTIHAVKRQVYGQCQFP